MNHKQRLDAIEAMPSFIQSAILEAEGDEVVDVLGAANSTQTRIGTVKRRAASEISDGAAGSEWRFEQGRMAKRSYNTEGLLASLSRQIDEVGGLAQLLMFLVSKDIIRLQWQWSPLSKLVKERNLELRVARHEIEDGDPDFDIGEYWKDGSPSYRKVDDGE